MTTEQKFTAEDARKLSGPSVDDFVAEAIGVIRQAARDRKRFVHLHDSFWTHGGYAGTEQWKAACKVLRELGFKVEFFYEERQFVDMYTIVSWDAS